MTTGNLSAVTRAPEDAFTHSRSNGLLSRDIQFFIIDLAHFVKRLRHMRFYHKFHLIPVMEALK